MGYEKDRQIREWDQGWSLTDTTVCHRCLSDSYLREMAKDNASEHECSYCERVSRKDPIAIPFDELMGVIGEAVFQYYDHCENEAIAWDREDEQYVGTTYQTYELVHWEIPTPSDREDVLDDIVDSLGDNVWCDKNPYSLTGAERIFSSWEDFCNTVKHDTRYFFDSTKTDEWSEKIPVPAMLDELRDIIAEAGLIGAIPVGTQFYRVRPHKRSEPSDSWETLGSPPPQRAVSNRMSAAGISVFYAGLDLATARAETTANLLPTDRRRLTAGMWTNTRPLNILDLTKLPIVPSFYARVRYERDHLIFLQQFVEDITKPVTHDGREHIDYVPTQVLTEYFRHQYKLPDKARLDGIVYPSAQRKRGKSIVIFASHADLDPRTDAFFNTKPPPPRTRSRHNSKSPKAAPRSQVGVAEFI